MGGSVRIEGEDLIFELHGVDEILSIKRSVSVPLKHVISVSTLQVPWNLFKGLRVGGSSLPGVVKDGRYLTEDGLMFFEMHDPDKCITVNLDHEHYKKIVFEVDDKEASAEMISKAINRNRQLTSQKQPD